MRIISACGFDTLHIIDFFKVSCRLRHLIFHGLSDYHVKKYNCITDIAYVVSMCATMETTKHSIDYYFMNLWHIIFFFFCTIVCRVRSAQRGALIEINFDTLVSTLARRGRY